MAIQINNLDDLIYVLTEKKDANRCRFVLACDTREERRHALIALTNHVSNLYPIITPDCVDAFCQHISQDEALDNFDFPDIYITPSYTIGLCRRDRPNGKIPYKKISYVFDDLIPAEIDVKTEDELKSFLFG